LTTWFFTLGFGKADLLVFKDTSNKAPKGHPTGTTCKPDFIAAFHSNWRGDIAWPFVRLTGQKASAGEPSKSQALHAISYLHYLLLARPDLHVAQGLLTSNSKIMFLLGTGGVGVQKFSVKWDDKDLYRLLVVFTYRLYEPAGFADPSYIQTDFDKETSGAMYTIRIKPQGSTQEIICSGFNHIYARNPFATRTHVFSNPNFKVKDVVVIKDQLCRVGRRFDELEILKRVHESGRVPGVVNAEYGEVVTKGEGRWKRRLGFSESGSPFTSIPTPRKMLETLFDLLEGI
jgi:hypothetical protein